MAAQVASQSSDGSQNRDSAGGVSYASAVLNFKNMDNNKENINATTVGPTPMDSVTKEAPVKNKTVNNPQHKTNRQPNTYATASKLTASTEEFPQINSANPKNSRRLGQPTKVERDQNNKLKPSQSLSVCDSADSVKDSDNSVKPSLSGDLPEGEVNTVETAEEVPEKKKFVEAPLPKINPWTKNKNAASVITGKTNEAPVAAAPIQVPIVEKRVLQPQQQGTVGKSIYKSIFLLKPRLSLVVCLFHFTSL